MDPTGGFVKYVTKSELDARRLPFWLLRDVATPCLNWCQEYISARPNKDEIPTIFRRRQLQEQAQSVFPYSCHTEFSNVLVTEFAHFREYQERLVQMPVLGKHEISRELRRPKLRHPLRIAAFTLSAGEEGQPAPFIRELTQQQEMPLGLKHQPRHSGSSSAAETKCCGPRVVLG